MEERAVKSLGAVCQNCKDKGQLEFDFTMAFQPIISHSKKQVFGYEALVRGLCNESAYSILSQVNDENRYRFDQACRVKAIALASKLKIDSILSINFLPKAIYKPERCIRSTINAAKKYNFPLERILFEFTESEQVEDTSHLKDIVDYYKSEGFLTAIDDFGAGHSGLNLLADFQTNIIKLDMALIRGVDQHFARQKIVLNCLNLFSELNVTPLAEGIETKEEMTWLAEAGVDLMQGYYFAKPGFESLSEVDFSCLD